MWRRAENINATRILEVLGLSSLKLIYQVDNPALNRRSVRGLKNDTFITPHIEQTAAVK